MKPDPDNGGRRRSAIFSDRWRLAALTRDEWTAVGVAAILGGFLFAMFHYMGNTVENVATRSAFTWMWARWQDKLAYGGADYSHGPLIPLVSLWAVWHKRRELMAAPRSMNLWGLALVVVALLLHWVGAKMQQTRVSLMALILLLWALPMLFYGWKVAKHLIFPAAFLIFCIPMNFLGAISFPLRILMTKISVGLLNGFGLNVVRNGSAILGLNDMGAQSWAVDVEEPCSGLRSLLAMTAITAVYAWVTQPTLLKKWLLFACSIPLAIASNVVRILFIGLMSEAFGVKIATGLPHDYAGYAVFAVAILLMVAIDKVLNAHVGVLVARVRAWRGGGGRGGTARAGPREGA